MEETPSLVDSSSVPTSAPPIVAAPNTDCSATTKANSDTVTSRSEPVVHEDDGDDEWQDDQDDPDDLQDEPNKNTLVSPPKVSCPVNPIPELDDDDDENENHNLPPVPGVTSWRERNPWKPVIPVRQHLKHVMGPEQRATAKIKAKTVKKRTAALHDDIATLHAERETQAAELAKKHGFKPVLDRYDLHELRRCVKINPELRNISPEFAAKLKADLAIHHARTKKGARSSNTAAAVDARYTINRIATEINDLAERSGTYGIALFSKGHVQDLAIPYAVHSWDALDFFQESLNIDPVDLVAMFEQWCCAQKKGEQAFVIMMVSFLHRKKTKVTMNYERYIKAVIFGYNYALVGYNYTLVGWPTDVNFGNLTNISTVDEMKQLRDALRDGSCKWKCLSPAEVEKWRADYNKKCLSPAEVEKWRADYNKKKESGEIVKGHSKAKQIAEDQDSDAASSGEDNEDNEGEEEEEHPEPKKRAAGGRSDPKPRVKSDPKPRAKSDPKPHVKAGGEKGKGNSCKATKRKGHRDSEEDEEEESHPKKKLRDKASKSGTKHRRAEEDGSDDEPPQKRAKEVQLPRPKPKPKTIPAPPPSPPPNPSPSHSKTSSPTEETCATLEFKQLKKRVADAREAVERAEEGQASTSTASSMPLRLRRLLKMDAAHDPWATLLAKLAGINSPLKARQVFQQYMHESYKAKIGPAVKACWEGLCVEEDSATLRSKKGPDAPFQVQVTRAWEEAQTARAAYLKAMKCIDNLGVFIWVILRGVCNYTGLQSFAVFGGPIPQFNGEIRTVHVSYGRNHGAVPSHFLNWLKTRFNRKVLDFMKEYLQTAFTPVKCAESAIPAEEEDPLAQAKRGFERLGVWEQLK
ncbi:hypothetical protein DFH09DRAFT_1307912 [Mycena vulgaris]|nr:hypothetical protein DFH09DRAFT_1307912 [Mycena vulgaris]